MSASFVKFVADRLLGKTVEVYQGNEHDKLLYSDSERTRKSIITGVLIEAAKECLVLEITKNNKKNLVYINSWSVQTIMEKNELKLFDVYSDDEWNK